jgi:hypothetical protein
MKKFYFIVTILFSTLSFSQELDVENYLDGTWCDKDKFSCFNLISDNGLLIYEIPDGGFISGVEIIKHDTSSKKIYWRLVGTNKETQYFEIINKDKVKYFDGQKTKSFYRHPRKD